MGSGTVLLEGILANIEKVYGNDLNPLAHRISKAKTTLIGDEIVQYRDKLVFDLEKEYEKYDKILNMVTGYVDEELEMYYHVQNLHNHTSTLILCWHPLEAVIL